MKQVLAILNFILPFLNTAAFLIENLDPNDTGTDDKTADALKRIVNELRAFVSGNTPDAEAAAAATGLRGITAFGNSVLAALDELLISTAPKDARVEQGTALVRSLSDPTKVFQAKRGDDADALQKFKIEAERKLIQLQAV